MGLALPLVALYILKIRRERRIVSSIALWYSVGRDLQAKSPFRRLLLNVPLIIQLLVVLLLSLALAGPIVRSPRLSDPRAVLVVDVSASMGAIEAGETRLTRAVRTAREVLGRFSPGTQIMLLAAGRTPELISPFESDRKRLDTGLDRLSLQEVEGQLGPALAMAADSIREHGAGRILVLTDAAISDAESLVAPNWPTEVLVIRGSADNTAIVRTEVTRGLDPVSGRDRVEVFALLTHQGSRPRSVFVTLSQRNVVGSLASRQIRLTPGERAPVVLGFEIAPADAGSGLILEISPPDALTSDDRSHVRVPFGRKLPVVLAPKRANVWIARALRADPEIDLYTAEFAELTTERVPNDALVVVDGACPEKLPGADLLLLNPPEGPCRTLTVGATVDRPLLTSWSETDPRLRYLTLDGVDIARARSLRPERVGDALVHAQQGVLLADVSSPGRMGTLVGFDVGASTWPLKASFVLFLRNVVELARAHRESSLSAPARTGDPLRLRVPLDVATVTVEDPSGRREPLAARSGLVVIPAPRNVGFLHVSWAGSRPGSILVPANLSSEVESRIAPRALPSSLGKATEGARGGSALGLEGWLALLALGLVALDLALFTHRPRRAGPLDRTPPRVAERRPLPGSSR